MQDPCAAFSYPPIMRTSQTVSLPVAACCMHVAALPHHAEAACMMPSQHVQNRLHLQQDVACGTALLCCAKVACMAPSQHRLKWLTVQQGWQQAACPVCRLPWATLPCAQGAEPD